MGGQQPLNNDVLANLDEVDSFNSEEALAAMNETGPPQMHGQNQHHLSSDDVPGGGEFKQALQQEHVGTQQTPAGQPGDAHQPVPFNGNANNAAVAPGPQQGQAQVQPGLGRLG